MMLRIWPSLCALLLALPWVEGPAMAQQSPQVEISSDPAVVVLEYDERIGLLADPDPTPLLRIFGDGTARLHRSPPRTAAGDYELQLHRQELRELMLSLVSKGLLEVDLGALRQDVDEAARLWVQAARRNPHVLLTHVSDLSTTEIRLQLDHYQPTAGPGRDGVEWEIRWPGLGEDAERYPELPGLQRLAAAGREVRALLTRNGWQRVVPEGSGGQP